MKTIFCLITCALLFVSLGDVRAGGPNPISTAGLDPNQAAVANSINSGNPTALAGFSGGTPPAGDLALAINNLPAGQQGAALNQLSPEEFGRFTSITAFNNALFETEAMDDYLAGRRDIHGDFLGGNGHVDVSGLNVNNPDFDPTLSLVHSRLLAWNPAPATGVISDVANPILGGMDMKDDKDMKSLSREEALSPWNFFVRGNVILAQGFSQTDVSHFDSNTESVVIGSDYRISKNFLVGLTAGYGHTDVTLDNNGSSATVDSYSPGFYASYADKGWYANLTGDYAHNAYTQSRAIAFIGQTATSAPEGNEGTANIDGGYDFHRGAFTFGPLAGLQYTHLTVDGYNEAGSALANLSVNNQDADSLRSRLGGRVSYVWSIDRLTVTPHLDATWNHEFLDQARGINSSFEGAALASFNVRTDRPSRDFALANLGVDVDLNRTMTVFSDYSVQAGQQNYFGQAVRAGLRIGF